jgi:hypothetical protein
MRSVSDEEGERWCWIVRVRDREYVGALKDRGDLVQDQRVIACPSGVMATHEARAERRGLLGAIGRRGRGFGWYQGDKVIPR